MIIFAMFAGIAGGLLAAVATLLTGHGLALAALAYIMGGTGMMIAGLLGNWLAAELRFSGFCQQTAP